LRSGFTIVLAGRPNVGKSSLLNMLAGEEAAIVTAVAGTTRDAVVRSIVIEGMAVNVIDTAGLRAAADEVEILGMARTRREIERADLVLHVVEAGVVTPEDESAAKAIPAGIARLTVHNKSDVSGEAPGIDGDIARLSAKTGVGLDALRQELLRRGGLDGAGEDVIIARERHLVALEHAAAAATAANAHLTLPVAALELAAEELRQAQEALNTITGAFGADDLLGEIFGRFCIGK
jgi:tRNA modification GTPase